MMQITKSFYSKVAGSSFKQENIWKLRPNSKLRAVRDRNNKYDEFAIIVEGKAGSDWLEIGFIPAGVNKDIAEAMDQGVEVKLDLEDITGGTEDKPTTGINIGITYTPKVDFDYTKFTKLIPDIGEGYVYFDEASHTYYNEEGKQLISGSKYEERFSPEFNSEYPARAIAKATGLKKDVIKDIWEAHGKVASAYGTTVHAGLELYYKSRDDMRVMDEAKGERHTASNYMPEAVGEIVDAHVAKFGKLLPNPNTEVFVRSGDRCGFLDLINLDGKEVDMFDYKIIKELKKIKYDNYGSYNKYSLQQNFYRSILEDNGYKVRSMALHVYNDKGWVSHEVERIDIKPS